MNLWAKQVPKKEDNHPNISTSLFFWGVSFCAKIRDEFYDQLHETLGRTLNNSKATTKKESCIDVKIWWKRKK